MFCLLIFLLIAGCRSVCETSAPFRGGCLFVLKTFAGSWLRAAAWQGCLVNYTLLSTTLEATEDEDDEDTENIEDIEDGDIENEDDGDDERCLVNYTLLSVTLEATGDGASG